MLYLDNSFSRGHFTITVVGCGGTGGFAAESLARLIPPRANLVLIDHDRVEERNLTRQNFTREELGQFKSEALARRLSRRYRVRVAYSTLPVMMTELRCPGLIIGCVDNGPARREIAKRVQHSGLSWVGGYSHSVPREMQSGPQLVTSGWWVDAGNAEDYGQILIGNTDEAAFREDVCLGFPLPTIQRPDLLRQVQPQRNCADLPEQGPIINQAMAALVVEVVRRLIEGTCPWVQLYLDLQNGTLTPVFAQDVANKERKEVKHGRD